MKKYGLLIRFFTIVLIAGMIMPHLALAEDSGASSIPSASDDAALETVIYKQEGTYAQYLAKHASEKSPVQSIVVEGSDFAFKSSKTVFAADSYHDKSSVLVFGDEKGTISCEVDVDTAGLYAIDMTYEPMDDNNKNITFSLMVNGEIPFDQASRLIMTRTYRDKNKIVADNQGNDLRPKQVAETRWLQEPFLDKEGQFNDPFQFYFQKGRNTITLTTTNGMVAIDHLRLYNEKPLPLYKKYAENAKPQSIIGVSKRVPANDTIYKSDSVLYPTYDRFNVDTIPNSPTNLKMNVIGGTNWSDPGQFIVWNLNVDKDGWYKLGLRYRKNLERGKVSYRRLSINGEVPFKEASMISFEYSDKWQTEILGDGNQEWLFYLKSGDNELRLDVTPGQVSEVIQEFDGVSYTLNLIYRKILMITGASPDSNRDYMLQDAIPGLMDEFADICKRLEKVGNKLVGIVGKNNAESALSTVDMLITQICDFIDDPDLIASRLVNFQSNIGSFTDYVLQLSNQPLEINYFQVMSAEQTEFAYKASFADRITYSFKAFIGTFINDYSYVGNETDANSAITVWVGGVGRDQVQVIKDLVDSNFTPNYGIAVNLSLVQQGLIPAILSNRAPDVSLFGASGTEGVVDLAARDGLTDLTKFDTYSQVESRFQEGSMVPFQFEGGVYALPLTQSFQMMFCRMDILNELNLNPPNTWDDFYKVLAVLQKNNLNIGLPNMFTNFLYQDNMTYYNDSLTKTNFDTTKAVAAFTKATDLYTLYGIPLSYNGFNRFRTGEMPIMLEEYTMFNQLTVAAPELKGVWNMYPIPGTVHQDGSINRSVAASSAEAVILKYSTQKESAWEFLDWFTSADIQAQYGLGVESILGAAGRYGTANKEALELLPWNEDQLSLIKEQRDSIILVPVTPASYYVSRNITNAFRQVTYYSRNPHETLLSYNRQINQEILRKRNMLGLDS